MSKNNPKLETTDFKYIRTVQHGMIPFSANGRTLAQFYRTCGLAETEDKILSAGFIEKRDGRYICTVGATQEEDQKALDHLLSSVDQDIRKVDAARAWHVKPFQDRAWEWANAAFGETISKDIEERCLRFLEEAGELVQSLGMTKDQAMEVISYVYDREKGDINQEIAGVEVSLAVLSTAVYYDKANCAETELARCWEKIDQIREKQRNKPKPISVDSR